MLSKTQIGMILTSILLIVSLGSVILLAYVNINTASAFRSGFVLSELANLQREVIQLHIKTNRLLRDQSRNFSILETQRERLNIQLELAIVESDKDPRVLQTLRNISYLLEEYDYHVTRLRSNPSPGEYRNAAPQFDSILELMEKQVQSLYGNEELRFYNNVGDALTLQRISQTLTVAIGGLVLLFGILLARSLGHTVNVEFERAYRLLQGEVKERRKAEEELRHQNAYLAALHETTLALMNRLEVADLLEAIVTRAAELLGTEHGYVYLIDDEGRTIERRVGMGIFSHSIGFHLQPGEGLAGKVWQSEEPMIVNDYAQWPGRTRTPGAESTEEQIRSVMGVPLKSGQEVVGVIGLADDGQMDRTFGENELELLISFAQLASIALDNAQLFAQAERRMLQIEALYRADEELYRHLDLDEVLRALVDVAVDILKVNKSSVLVWNEEAGVLIPRAARGFSPETLEEMRFSDEDGLIGIVASEAEPIIIEDTALDPRVNREITSAEGIRSFMHVPITVDGEVFGVFNVNYTTPRTFTEDDRRLILALAQRAALAIENARLYEQAQQAATVEERQRLARELHDAVTQTLFSASLIAEVLPRLWEMNPEEGRRRLKELRELTRGALAEMRTLLLELRPTALIEAPIDDLMYQLAEAMTGRARVPVSVSAQEECPLPLNVKVALYRIAQEALNNIAKHANATHAELVLNCDDEYVALQIHDDGIGFSPGQTLPDSLGLAIMQERAEDIGARLTIRSAPNAGTDVIVRWPARAMCPVTKVSY